MERDYLQIVKDGMQNGVYGVSSVLTQETKGV